eukprot:scaffold11809_cov128-Cylindrotheca_fusiformis.AAC.14
MGCGQSKLQAEGSGNGTAANQPQQRQSELVRELQKESTPDIVGDVRANSRPAIRNMVSTPQLVNQLKETTAVALPSGANKGAGVHHLKNVFAAPLDDLKSFQAPSFPKGQAERAFIREALEKNFVFAALSEIELRTIIDAFESSKIHQGDTLIRQGDIGDYFYIMRAGKVRFELNGNVLGHATKGKSFGELALLYTSPRAASVIAETPTTVYRVDQKTFRYIMQSQTLQTEGDKKNLLQGISFLQDLEASDLNKLVHTMTPRKFEQGEYILIKGEEGDTFYVIQEGHISVTDITIGSTDFEDQVLGPGDYFGERALLAKEPRSANCIAKSNGIALTIDKETFEKVLGKFAALMVKSEDKRKLTALRIFQTSQISQPTVAALATQFTDKDFKPKTEIIQEGKPTEAALYFIREGKVRLSTKDGSREHIIDAGGYFGEDMLEIDLDGLKKTTECVAKYTVTTFSDGLIAGVLPISECRKIFDTTQLSSGKSEKKLNVLEGKIKLDQLKKHGILGAGTFGQVWLVTDSAASEGATNPYALKIQSKYELIQNHQAKGVIQEKNLLKEVRHPFVINLVETYQDEQYLYLLLGLVQGGELFSLMHQTTYDGMSEKDAKFYGSAVLEGLSHIHRQHILYRDLKAENVLIDSVGYPVIVDFGFDIYFMWDAIVSGTGAGYTPFFEEGMDQITLFRRICKAQYQFPPAGVMSMEVEDLLQRFFVLDPTKRLGSLSRGINEIHAHLWYDSIDFGALRHKDIKAPWVPRIKNPLDKSNFENWDHLEDKTMKSHATLTPEEQKIFDDY